MSAKSDHCNCSDTAEFDARRAYQDLARKHEQLADLVARYMAEAGMKRAGRVQNALKMSADVHEQIIGGNPASEGDFPECCLVGQTNPSGQFVWFCTGVLIRPRAVVTAAHCFNPSEGRVPNVVALNCRSVAPSDLSNAEIIRLQKAPIRNPLFSSFSRTNDSAVLILNKEASIDSVAVSDHAETNASQQVRVVGFGSDTAAGTQHFGLKRFVDIPITFIRRTPQDNLNAVEGALGFESDLEFVAGGNGHDACLGDSGGPAYINVGGEMKVAGLVSRKVKNALQECGSGGVYTRLDGQEEFIQSVISSNNL